MPEIKRRPALRWAAFGKVDVIMRSPEAGMKIRRKGLSEYVTPVMNYDTET